MNARKKAMLRHRNKQRQVARQWKKRQRAQTIQMIWLGLALGFLATTLAALGRGPAELITWTAGAFIVTAILGATWNIPPGPSEEM